MKINNLTIQLAVAAFAMTFVGVTTNADQPKSDSYTQIESDFNSAQKTTFKDLASYGEFSRSNVITPTTTQITTDNGAWSYYVVDVVQDQEAPNPATLLVKSYPLLSVPQFAQTVIRADNTMTVENLFNNKNLDCYDYSRLPTTLVSQETDSGVVLTNSQRDFYKVSPTCTPKYDKIITTIKQSDLFLVTRIDYVKGDVVTTVYTYGWKN